MAIWELKDLRRWCIKHPLEGAKISTEQDYPFHWEFSSLTLKLNNFEGALDSIARGDRVIIHNRAGTEIRFAGTVDNIKSNPKTYYLEVYVLNDAITLKDEPAFGNYEEDEDGERTGNVIASVNAVKIEKALEKALYSLYNLSGAVSFGTFAGMIFYYGTKRFNADFASSEQFLNTPYSQYGTISPSLYGYIFSKSRPMHGVAIPEPRIVNLNDKIQLCEIFYDHGNYYKRFYDLDGGVTFSNNKKWDPDIQELDSFFELPNELKSANNYNETMINIALEEINEKYPLGDIYIKRELFKIYKSGEKYYFIIRDNKEITEKIATSTFLPAEFYRYHIGIIDNYLNYISFSYTNPKMIDIVKDMAILTNALWWVTQEPNTSLPTLHFYPRETIYAAVDIAQYRARIDDIDEEFIYREFDREISDNVILSDLLKNNIKKYYQEQSGEYVKTKIKLFAREIGDTFGVTIMADVKYGKYTIGRALTFEFLDEHTTVVTCMKSSKTYKRWYR